MGAGVDDNLPSGICASCGRAMAPRRRWAGGLDEVRYCSRACRSRRVNRLDRRLEAAILALLDARAVTASICPSEAAREVSDDERWRALMEPARRAARRLAHRGLVEITQRGRVVDPCEIRGPVRIRRSRQATQPLR